MSLESRLRRLEEGVNANDDGLCRCGGPFRVMWPDGTVLRDAPCPHCGRPRLTIRVIYGPEVATVTEVHTIAKYKL
jgi:hypothetical protein